VTIQQIRDALTRSPFEPFDLRLVDGRSFTIHHTDYLSVPPVRRPRHVIVYTPIDDDPEDCRTHFIDPLLIVDLTIPTTTPAAPGSVGNGQVDAA
jgi:hypothetical protein